MPLPLKYYQRNVCISSLPFIFPDIFCFEGAWNSNRLMATLQLYWLTVSGQALQCLRIHPEMGAGELLNFPTEGRRWGRIRPTIGSSKDQPTPCPNPHCHEVLSRGRTDDYFSGSVQHRAKSFTNIATLNCLYFNKRRAEKESKWERFFTVLCKK